MKTLIIGKTSYIGTNICAFLNLKGFLAETVSVRNGVKDIDFSDTDAVVHCAAVVHKNEKEFFNQYYDVNVRLAVETALKAKSQGASLFVFISTMSVYGDGVTKISRDTKTAPTSLYGKTKLEAERELEKLSDDSFKVAIVRPPMVYGKDCPGNYRKLSSLVKKIPVFPKADNKKSMLYVENLSFFIYGIIKDKLEGVFMPMDNEYVSTSYMAEVIAKTIGKKIIISAFLGVLVKCFKCFGIVRKAFGTLYYDEDCASKIYYIDFEKAIEDTERN